MSEYEQIMQGLVSLHEATEKGFESVDARFAAQDTRLDRVERQMRYGFAGVNSRLDRIERNRGKRGGDRP